MLTRHGAATRPLLSIAIPTWNRRAILDDCLDGLAQALDRLAARWEIRRLVEVVVSDNASDDGTWERLGERVAAFPCPLRRYRHGTNLGAARNLISLLDRADGDYFLFIGDDDRLVEDGLDGLLAVLQRRRPNAVIQIDEPGARRIRWTDMAGACRWFDSYGNAYCGCIRLDLARQACARFALHHHIPDLVWPQTAFGFLGMHLAGGGRTVALVNWPIGTSPLWDRLNVASTGYFARSMCDLLEIAWLVERASGCGAGLDRLLAPRSRFLRHHLRGLARMALLGPCDRPALEHRLAHLRRRIGPRLLPLGWRVRAATCRPLSSLLWIAAALTRGEPPWAALRRLRSEQAEHGRRLAQRQQAGVRRGDQFSPAAADRT